MALRQEEAFCGDCRGVFTRPFGSHSRLCAFCNHKSLTAQWTMEVMGSKTANRGIPKTINVKPQPRVDNSLVELEEFLNELTGDSQWS